MRSLPAQNPSEQIRPKQLSPKHPASKQQSPKKPELAKISLFTLLGGAILIAFNSLVGASLWGQYHLTNQIIDKEVVSKVRKNHALLQTVLDGQLKLVSSQLIMLSRQEELSSLPPDSSLLQIETPLNSLIDHQSQASANDFILLGSPDGRSCNNTHQILTTERIDCQLLIQQFDSSLYDWHLAKFNTNNKLIISTLTRTPIIAANGKVLAYLYGGIVLTDNLPVLNQTIRSGGDNTDAVGIAYQNQIIASSAPQGSAEYETLLQAAEHPDQLVQTVTTDLYGMSQQVELEHPQKHDVRFLSAIRTDGRDELQQGLIQQTSGILILSILLAVLVVSLTIKISLTPLGRLRDLAKQRHKQTLTGFNPGPITEFQQLSYEVAKILTELKHTEQQLRDNSYQLALSHKEQKNLNQRNQKLLHQLFNLQEQERKHLAQELHDQLGQPLAVINTDAYLIRTDKTANDKIINFSQSIQNNVNEMSDVVYNRIKSLRPMPLNDLGLLEAIRHMPALDNLKQLNIGLAIDLPPALPRLSEQHEIHLFRIIQESLTNIIKHSQADQAWLSVKLYYANADADAHAFTTLELEIRDNGIGCSKQILEQTRGFGVNGMIERVNSMDGSWSMIPDSVSGTCIRVRLLLPEAQQQQQLQKLDD